MNERIIPVAVNVSGLLRDFWWHIQHLHIHLDRYSDNVNVINRWHYPVSRLRDMPISGDAIARWKGTP